MIELYIKRLLNISISISTAIMVIAKLFKITNSYFVKTGMFLFVISLFLLGIWSVLGTIYRWKSFKKAYKSIDLEKIFGGFGSIIYVILGLASCMASIFLLYRIIFKIN